MFVQINAAAERPLILLHAEDNVAIARAMVPAGQAIEVGGGTVTARRAIPEGHKMAIRAIAAGEPVRRYGEVIGFAQETIPAGEHVHEHNLRFSALDVRVAYERRPEAVYKSTKTFLGFPRRDGRTGTRNYIAVVAASNCAAHAVGRVEESFREIALPPNVDGVVAFPHGDGCGQSAGADTRLLQRTLEGVLDHPNVAAALIIGLGCEVNQIDHYLGEAGEGERSKTLKGLTLQESGGTRAVVEQARRQIDGLLEEAAAQRRRETPASELVVGLNCGGSDSFSGITANPALGWACDRLVEEGAAVVLAETTEIFGAEHLLLRRARSEAVGRKLVAMVDWYKGYL